MQRINYLDGWRGYAILSVLAGHFLHLPYINLGRFGVELFFVLSGRLMAEILFERKVPLAKFFQRRIIRVYPAFFVFVVLSYICFSDKLNLLELFSALTFTFNYIGVENYTSSYFHHIWSLCVEEHMYVLLAIIAWCHRKVGLKVDAVLAFLILAMMANALLSQKLAGMGYIETYWRSDVRGASILLGALAYLKRDAVSRALPFSGLATASIGAIALALNTNPVPDIIKYSLGTAALAVALVSLPDLIRPLQRTFEFTLLRWFGLVSFSLYLWQQPFYAMKNDGIMSPWSGLAFALALALLSYSLIESAGRKRMVGFVKDALQNQSKTN